MVSYGRRLCTLFRGRRRPPLSGLSVAEVLNCTPSAMASRPSGEPLTIASASRFLFCGVAADAFPPVRVGLFHAGFSARCFRFARRSTRTQNSAQSQPDVHLRPRLCFARPSLNRALNLPPLSTRALAKSPVCPRRAFPCGFGFDTAPQVAFAIVKAFLMAGCISSRATLWPGGHARFSKNAVSDTKRIVYEGAPSRRLFVPSLALAGASRVQGLSDSVAGPLPQPDSNLLTVHYDDVLPTEAIAADRTPLAPANRPKRPAPDSGYGARLAKTAPV